jgi:hypothetical protein
MALTITPVNCQWKSMEKALASQAVESPYLRKLLPEPILGLTEGKLSTTTHNKFEGM